MLQKVKSYILRQNLLKNGDTVVVGVSGGPDSMALLHILAGLRPELGIRVAAAHLNHGIRAESGNEEEYVGRVCRELQVEYFSAQRNIPALARRERKSLEETGREERYRFFDQVLRRAGADVIATAHHKDDAAETVLLHLLRGSGIKGLRGILPRSGVLIRPLLCTDKQEILAFLHEQGIDFCQDQSNRDLRYTRNRIRHNLLPYLQTQFNRQVVENLNRLADIAREENDWLEELADKVFKETAQISEDHSVILDSRALQDQPVACQRRVLVLALTRLGGENGWEWNDIERIRELQTKAGSRRSVPLRKGLVARKVYDRLILTSQPVVPVNFCQPLDCIPGCVNIPEIGLGYSFFISDAPPPAEPKAICLDYEKLGNGPLYLRSRRPGDRIRPAGGRGSKKIKDYFIDCKLPWEERDLVPLLASDREIHAILGFCVAEQVRIDSSSRQILVIMREPPADNA